MASANRGTCLTGFLMLREQGRFFPLCLSPPSPTVPLIPLFAFAKAGMPWIEVASDRTIETWVLVIEKDGMPKTSETLVRLTWATLLDLGQEYS